VTRNKQWNLPASLLSLFFLPLMAGCAYERVDILVGDDLYMGRTLSHYTDVEVTRNGIVLKPGARFAIETPDITQFLGQFEVAIVSGEGMTAYLRTVPHEFDTTKGVAFRYSTQGSYVRMPDGAMIPLPHNAENGQHMVSLYNEAALVSISVDCNRLFEEPTSVPGTAYVIFETLPGSTVELRTINFFETDVY
jgi:hypothetical protein